ncbi:hypothetical protein VTO73DRAFT_3011 [Trametes versicolor]
MTLGCARARADNHRAWANTPNRCCVFTNTAHARSSKAEAYRAQSTAKRAAKSSTHNVPRPPPQRTDYAASPGEAAPTVPELPIRAPCVPVVLAI